jgi:hypothetical protein
MRTVTWQWPWSRRAVRTRILLIDDYVPDVTIGAGLPRMVELLRALCGAGAEVTLLPTDRILNLEVDRKYAVGAVTVISCGVEWWRYVQEQRNAFDGIIVSRPHNMAGFRHFCSGPERGSGKATIV